tara:strand:- start:1717 stop:2082 length:366 start_codon:yes stop_codon:yes gene_type:complete
MIECKKCFQKFEFTERERNWYMEMGFKDPKKCKSCKDAEKNKKTYSYTPSKAELQRKEAMRTAKTSKRTAGGLNMFSMLDEVNEEEEAEQVVPVVMKSSNWCDMVESDDKMDWSVPVRWVS